VKAEKAERVEVSPGRSRLLGMQLALLCIIVFLSPLVAGRLTAIPALSVQVLVFVAALLWLVSAARRRTIELPGGGVSLLAGIFFALLVLSSVHSVSLHLTLRELLNVACYLLVFLMVAGLGSNRQAVYGILGCLALSAMLVGTLGVKEYVLTREPGWRTFSTFFNPDFLAGFMALMLPVVLAWYLSGTSPGISAVAGLSALLVFANILMSGSRFGAAAAVGGVAIVIVLALLSGSMKRAQFVRIAILLLPTAVVFLTLSRPLAGRIASIKAESHSGGFRIYTWRGTARTAAAHPLNGTGLGTFEIGYPKYALVGYTKLAHNSYLQLAAEAGPASAIFLITLLGACVLPPAVMLVRRRVRDDASEAKSPAFREFEWMPDRRLMVSGLLAGSAASMARNLVDSDWYVTAIGIGFWAVLGAAVGLAYPQPAGNRPVTRGRAAAGMAALSLMILGALVMSAGELCAVRGNALWELDPDGAVTSYRQAAKLDPLNAGYHRRLAGAYLTLASESADASYAKHAEEELHAAIRLEPAYAKNYYQLGRVYGYFGRDEAAIQAYETALERDPNALVVMLALARGYEEAGRANEATRVWKRMVRVEESPYGTVRAMPELVEPEYIFAHAALGRRLGSRGDIAGARKEYERALERVRRYEVSMNALRPVLEAGGRHDPEMEEQVREIRDDLLLRIEALGPD